jgi:cell division protein FtsL
MIEILLWVAMILGVYTLRQAAGKIEELEQQVKQQDERINKLQLMVESLVVQDSANDLNT